MGRETVEQCEQSRNRPAELGNQGNAGFCYPNIKLDLTYSRRSMHLSAWSSKTARIIIHPLSSHLIREVRHQVFGWYCQSDYFRRHI